MEPWGGANVDFEREIELSDSEVASIKQHVKENIDDWPLGLMEFLHKGPEELFEKNSRTNYPSCFFLNFQEVYGTRYFEPEPGDETKYWDEDRDVDYLYDKYEWQFNLEDTAYTVHILDEMKPT